MTKTTEWDCDDCRECAHRRVFPEGPAWCYVNKTYCPRDGCEWGVNKKNWGIE